MYNLQPSHSHITLSMIVRNEKGRYLQEALQHHRKYIDAAVIIDDASTDGTPELCLEMLHPIPVKLIRNKTSMFTNEVELRTLQWEETIRTNPEWILNLDADEWFEDKFSYKVRELLSNQDVDLYCFRMYDFWNRNAYRQDKYWQLHSRYRPLLLRYRNHLNYEWLNMGQHCGRFPSNIFQLPNSISQLRVKHMGWADPYDRIGKFQRYMRLDPEGQYGWLEQYYSILDDSPNLVEWVE